MVSCISQLIKIFLISVCSYYRNFQYLFIYFYLHLYSYVVFKTNGTVLWIFSWAIEPMSFRMPGDCASNTSQGINLWPRNNIYIYIVTLDSQSRVKKSRIVSDLAKFWIYISPDSTFWIFVWYRAKWFQKYDSFKYIVNLVNLT